MRGVPLGVAVVALGLYLIGLGSASFLDPPEGLHAEVAREMRARRDWVTPRVDGVRDLDEPPLLAWLLALAFAPFGATPFAARLPSALAAVAVAALTARLGVVLGGARVGLLAGLMVAANLGLFVDGRIVTPDPVLVLWLTLALAGFALAYRGGGRRGLVLFYASLGLTALTKDLLGALGPPAVIGLFFWLTRERPLAPWVPWWGVLLAAAIALPWYLAVETGSPGFLWYTLVDRHAASVARARVFPDAATSLSTLEFLLVTLLGFLPWAAALPWALRRAFRRPWDDATARLWLLFALWGVLVVGFFATAPFKLASSALPAFPALALLAARAWDETIEGLPGSAPPRALLAPLLALFVLLAAVCTAAWTGVLRVRVPAVTAADLAAWKPLVGRGAVLFAAASVLLLVAVRRRAPALGVGVALAATIAFLSVVAAEGMTAYVRDRATRPLAAALDERARPGDLLVHEGPIELSASALTGLPGPVHVVNGLRSRLAFGSTFPEARGVFWDAARLEAAWAAPGRHFLLSAVPPERSVVRSLPPGSVRLLAESGGRRLYSNLADGAASVR